MAIDPARLNERDSGGARHRRLLTGAVTVVLAVVVAACSSSAASNAPAQSVLPATSAPSIEASLPPASEAPSGAAPSLLNATGVPTNLDPCQLVPASEASQLAGTTYTAGKESTTQGNGKICTYGAQTLNVFMVIVGQAPDQATAQAEEAAAQAEMKKQAPNGLKVTPVSGIGDTAVQMSFALSEGGYAISGSSIYVLKGTVFFGFSDVTRGATAPSAAAMQAEAQLVLGRV